MITRLSPERLAAQRAARSSRVGPTIAVMIIATILLAVLFAVIGGVLIQAAAQRQHDEEKFVASWAQAEIRRDRALLGFVCEDLAYDDQWRDKIHQVELDTHHNSDAYFRGRDVLFRARDLHAIARQRRCASMFGSVGQP